MEDAEILYQSPGVTIALSRRATTLVPYGAAPRPNGDRNHGFFDLRDNAAAVDSIPEATKLAGLAAFLRVIANHPDLMTSGCEAAVFDLGENGDGPRFQAGSFVMVMFRDAERNRDTERFKALAHQTLGKVSPTNDHLIGFEFVIEPLRTFFGDDGCFAMEMKGIGLGDTAGAAWRALDYAMNAMARAISASPPSVKN